MAAPPSQAENLEVAVKPPRSSDPPWPGGVQFSVGRRHGSGGVSFYTGMMPTASDLYYEPVHRNTSSIFILSRSGLGFVPDGAPP